jgi:hypothetical protein
MVVEFLAPDTVVATAIGIAPTTGLNEAVDVSEIVIVPFESTSNKFAVKIGDESVAEATGTPINGPASSVRIKILTNRSLIRFSTLKTPKPPVNL